MIDIGRLEMYLGCKFRGDVYTIASKVARRLAVLGYCIFEYAANRVYSINGVLYAWFV